jgi:hypothetical protein
MNVETRKKTLEALDRHFQGMVRIGATSPGEGPAIEKALHGDLENNAGQTNIKRAIPEDYKYDPSAIKPMAKMLWSMSVSLGHALSAHKAFVRLKSATISPDGLLGGQGYVMAVKDVRTMLHDACEALSALCDTIHDEINAPHWQPKLGQLEKADVDKIKDLLREAQGYIDDPEELEKEDDEEDGEKDGHAGWHHPAVDKANKGKREPKSEIPEGGARETNPQAQPLRHDMRKPSPSEKQASVRGSTAAERVAAKFLQSNSSLPVETMPGGPRVDHLDRGDEDQTGPFGTYNRDEPQGMGDEWTRNDGFGDDYNYPSDYDNDLHEKQAAAKERPDTADQLYADIKNWEEKLKDYEAKIQYWEQSDPAMAKSLKRAVDNFKEHVARLRTQLAEIIGKNKRQADDSAGGVMAPTIMEHQPAATEVEGTSGPVLDHMVQDLQKRKKLEVTDGKKDFFILMKPSSMSKYEGKPTAFYAPSMDGKKPADQWNKMDEDQLRGWLQMLRPRPHAVSAATADAWNVHQRTAYDWSAVGTSAFPDANSDSTPTEAWDFGIGDGNGDDAHGQGAGGYGEGNPGAPDSNPGGGTGNMGVYGPQSGLPKDPGGKVNPDDGGDTTRVIENEIGGKGRYAKVIQFVVADGDPWAVKNQTPGTHPFGAPDFQEAVREEPVTTREASYESADFLRAVGRGEPWALEQLAERTGESKLSWYDGVYDFEHPVEPVGQSSQEDLFSANPMPGGPQEPYIGMFMEPEENFDVGADLPGDNDAGVARTDYYDGPKPINMQNMAPSTVGQTRLPGEEMPTPPKPVTQRPSHNQEHMFGADELPGDGTSVNYDFNRDLGPDQTTTYEEQNTPYIKWDDDTHEMRPDPIHQGDPVEGPYVHNDLTERPSNG